MKTPKERDSLSLLDLVCQLYYKVLIYPRSKEIKDDYFEARTELESRLTP